MGTSSRIPSAERALAVLRYLGSRARPVAASAIARDLDLPRSTTYHLLAVLAREGFVTRLPEERRFVLGPAAFEIADPHNRRQGLLGLARPLLVGLVAEVGHNGHLATLDGREVLYLAEERAPGGDLLVTDVDVRLPAHLTASGRALLAHLPAVQRTALYPTAASLVTRTGTGPRSLEALRTELRATRARGWAQEDGEVMPGLASVAAPAWDHLGQAVAALAVTFRRGRVEGTVRERLAFAVVAAAAALTGRLGGTPRDG